VEQAKKNTSLIILHHLAIRMIYRLLVVAQLALYGALAVQPENILPRRINEKDASAATDYDALEAFQEDAFRFRNLGSLSLPVKPPVNLPVPPVAPKPVKAPVKPPVKPPVKAPVKAPVYVIPPVVPPAKAPATPPVAPPAKGPAPVTKSTTKKPKKGRR
jgi:hypothetical protein